MSTYVLIDMNTTHRSFKLWNCAWLDCI